MYSYIYLYKNVNLVYNIIEDNSVEIHNTNKKKTNWRVIIISLLVIVLITVNQLTLIQITKNQLWYKQSIKNLSTVQEFIFYRQEELIKKWQSINFVNKVKEKYEELNEEKENDTEKRIIVNIVKSIYPGLTKYLKAKSNKRNSNKFLDISDSETRNKFKKAHERFKTK